MRKKIVLMITLLTFAGMLSADPGDLLNISSSILIPVVNESDHTTLTLGAGKNFWGIFELSAHTYLDIYKDKLEESVRVHSPESFSLGAGASIPMGGFYLKGDYQKFIYVEKNSKSYNVVTFGDSYKFGLGVPITEVLEIEAFYRAIKKGSGSVGYFGAGCIIKL